VTDEAVTPGRRGDDCVRELAVARASLAICRPINALKSALGVTDVGHGQSDVTWLPAISRSTLRTFV